MAQYASSSVSHFSVAVTNKLCVPIGQNLDDALTRTKTPSPGCMGYDASSNRLYYGDGENWVLLDNSTGDGDVIGPNSSTDNAVTRFNGTTGKTIQNSLVLIDDLGNISGIGTLNGKTLPAGAFGDVVGPVSSTDNAITRYDGITGKLVQNSSATVDDSGNLAGIGTINGKTLPSGAFGDVVGPASSTDNAITRYDGITGKLVQNSSATVDDSGNLAGIGTINGKALPAGAFGDVVGPGIATDNAIARYDGTTGKLIQNSAVAIDDAGAINGITTINGKTLPTGAFGDVVGPGIATDNAIARYDGTTGKLIQNSAVAIDDAGAINGITTINGKTLPTGAFGDVVGPTSSTDNAVARYDATTGKLIQNSVVLIDDLGNMTGVGTINGATVPSGTNTGDVTLTAFGAAPNANGASLSGQALTLQPATTGSPGGVSTTTQSFDGIKTFNAGIQFGSINGGTLNEYAVEIVSLDIRINGSVIVAAQSFMFVRIGYIVTITLPFFARLKADWASNGLTDAVVTGTSNPGIPANFRPAGTSYASMTAFLAAAADASGDVGFSPGIIYADSTGNLRFYAYQTSAAALQNWGDVGTGSRNGWSNQSSTYTI